VSEEQIRALLQRADEAGCPPVFGPMTAGRIRQQVRRRRIMIAAGPLAAAAVVLVGASLLLTRTKPEAPQPQEQRIASLETQIEQLRAQTDATLQLVQEVLAKDRQERRLAALEAELASIPDPRLEIERQVDETAFILVYRADKLYKELNQTKSAVEAYKEVIQLFPQNRWADVARERLSQIERRRSTSLIQKESHHANPELCNHPSDRGFGRFGRDGRTAAGDPA
jgi:tetratricopeptide (TPR) repeat protein